MRRLKQFGEYMRRLPLRIERAVVRRYEFDQNFYYYRSLGMPRKIAIDLARDTVNR